MIRLFRLFENAFLAREVSHDELLNCATDTLQRLIAGNPGALFNTVITRLTAALLVLETKSTDNTVKLGLRKAAKQAKSSYREVLPTQIGKIYAKVIGHYGLEAPQLHTVFPEGRDVFNKCKDDRVHEKLQAVITGLTPLAGAMGPPGAVALGDAGGLLSTWIALYAASEETTGVKTTTEAQKRSARGTVAGAMQEALFTVGLHAINEANTLGVAMSATRAQEKLALYFRQDLLENPDLSGPGLAAPENLQLVAAGSESVDATWDAVDGATGYILRRKGPGETEFSVVADTALLETQVGGLTPGDAYVFTVSAYDDEEESEPGPEVNFSP